MQRAGPRIDLGDDRRTAADVPHPDHHRPAADPAARPSESEQRRLCLTDSHLGCARCRSSADSPTESVAGGPLLPDYVATRLVVDDAPGRGRRTLLSSGAHPLLAALILGAMLLALIGASISSGAAGGLVALVERAGVGAAPAVVSVTPTGQPVPPGIPPTSGGAPSIPTPSPTMVAPSPSSPVSPTPAATASPPRSAVTYEVQPGDTLSIIAAAHGTSVEALVAANDLANANVILPGQELVIPQSGG